MKRGTTLGAWSAEAACLTDSDPDRWFAFESQATERAVAVAICMTCPVRTDCLDHALEHDEPFGIWGGKDERQRRAIRHRRLTGRT